MLKKLRSLTQRGDTIVEVMVVLAVLGLAIGISYATANRSLLDTREAQENAQATEIAQSQIEALRTLTQPGDTPNIFQAHPPCLAPVPAGCSVSANGGAFNYVVALTYTNVPAVPPNVVAVDEFTVTVTWPDAAGQGNDTVTLVYRLYQSS